MSTSCDPAKIAQSCQRFYEQKDTKGVPEECVACLASSARVDACPCRYDNGLCAFANCVNDAYTTNQQCTASYDALFNTQQNPFEYKDLKNCEIFSARHSPPIHEGLTNDTPPPTSRTFTQGLLWITLAFGLFVWWYSRSFA
jgi:hypothetical protein